MFSYAYSFNQNINTKTVTTQNGNTYYAWDVSNVEKMNYMFCWTQRFNKSLNDWNVSKVTNMKGMFERAVVFNKPINDWDVSNVKYMSEMFCNATSFNDNEISSWIINDNCTIFRMFRNSNIKRENLENKNYGNKIARYFYLPNPKTNDELEKIKIETIKKNIRILEENKNLPILCDDVEIIIKDFLIRKKKL
jgi:hypothetical protein